ncbi:MAG TPA: tetratricopeptide repeat protein [Pyrinomonadaceae bacterium]|nr:tetratricopeptide repeat protein [Pyrinomonadaceae bacterium]
MKVTAHIFDYGTFRHSKTLLRAVLLIWVFLVASANSPTVFGQPLSRPELVKLQEVFATASKLIQNGNAQQAVEQYTIGVGIAPSFSLLYVNRGVAYLSLAKYAEALADADKALSLMAGGPSELANAADIVNYSAVAYQVKGTALQSRGEYKPAIEAFSKSIELVPTEAKFRNSRGGGYRFLKDYDAALKDYDKAIELDPTVAMFFANRASIRLTMKNLDGAVADSDAALRIDKANENAYYTRATAYIELKKFPESLVDFNKAISLNPKSEFLHGRARYYFIQGNYDLAVKDYTDALVVDPANANAFGDRAVAYSRLGKNAEAIADIRKALALKGESALMRYTLAYLLYKTGQFAAAASEATRVIGLAPKWRDPYLVRANARVKLGEQAKAKADRDMAANLGAGNRPVENASAFDLELVVVSEEKDK